MYDEKKDVMVYVCQPPLITGQDGKETRLQVAVHRYNDGVLKIGISRLVTRKGEVVVARLGRMTSEEAAYVLVKLPEALSQIKFIELGTDNA